MNDDKRYDGILQVTAFGVFLTPSGDAGTERFGTGPIMVRRPVADELPDAFPTDTRILLNHLVGVRLPATFTAEKAANATWATDVRLRDVRYTGEVNITRERDERVVRVRSDEAPMSPVPVNAQLPEGVGHRTTVTFRLGIDRGRRVVAEDVTPVEQQ